MGTTPSSEFYEAVTGWADSLCLTEAILKMAHPHTNCPHCPTPSATPTATGTIADDEAVMALLSVMRKPNAQDAYKALKQQGYEIKKAE